MELQIGKYMVEITKSKPLILPEFYDTILYKDNDFLDYVGQLKTESEALSKALEVIKADSEIKEMIWIDGQKIEYVYDPVENRHLVKSGDIRFIGDTKLSALDQFFKYQEIKSQKSLDGALPVDFQSVVYAIRTLPNHGKLTYKNREWMIYHPDKTTKVLNQFSLELLDDKETEIIYGDTEIILALALIDWTAANTKPVVNREDEIAKILDLFLDLPLYDTIKYNNLEWYFKTYLDGVYQFEIYRVGFSSIRLRALTLRDLAVKLYEWSVENDPKS